MRKKTAFKKAAAKPVGTMRDGPLRAAFWQNESANGPFFTVTFERNYRNSNGEVRSAHAFSGTQLLQLAKLADRAYNKARELTAEARAQKEEA